MSSDTGGDDTGTVDDRAEALLADAREALAEAATAEDDDVAATPTLQAVADAAAGLVEETDSDALLAAVGLGGEDGYDSLTAALAEGDADRVRDLEGLLTLSTLAEEWDDPEAADHRADLADLLDVDGDGPGDGDDESADGADAEGSDPTETDDPSGSAADGEEAAQDDDSLLERVVDEAPDEGDVVVEAVERLASSTGDDGSDEVDEAGEEESPADESEGATDDLFADAVERFRSGIDRARADLDAFDEEEESDSEEGGGEADGERGTPAGRARRLSMVPDRGRSPTHHSTIPDRN
jgi:hypothetical protein